MSEINVTQINVWKAASLCLSAWGHITSHQKSVKRKIELRAWTLKVCDYDCTKWSEEQLSSNRIPKKKSENANSWHECVSVFLCVRVWGDRLCAHVLFVFCTAGDNGNAMYKRVRCVCQCVCIAHSNARTCYMLLCVCRTRLCWVCVSVFGRPNIVGICIYYTYFSRIRIT